MRDGACPVADIFISYARSDRERVAPLVAAIEADGWSVWWDPEIEAGQEFDRRIAEELKIASAVLVVWTPTSVESRWVRGEARVGADRGVLVPVRFGDAELPESRPIARMPRAIVSTAKKRETTVGMPARSSSSGLTTSACSQSSSGVR